MSARTLLLTVWYCPVRIVTWQDAVKMIYLGSVDVVAEYDEEIRSPSMTWKMPAVVRLRRKVRTFRRGVKFSRMNVYLRDRFTCQYCNRKLEWRELTYDHVVPKSRGGRTHFLNIVSACKACNTRKGNMTCDEAGMFPLNPPYQPRELPLAWMLAGRVETPPEWVPFVSPFLAT